jgi:hypothetical protein
MPAHIRRVEYYYAMVKDQPGEGHRLLSALASAGVDLLAFNAVPMGGETTQLVLFPADPGSLVAAARGAGLGLTGPQHAFFITGDDQLGAFARIHGRFAEARINVVAANGVTDGRGGFGYIVYVRPEDYDRAAGVLEAEGRA